MNRIVRFIGMPRRPGDRLSAFQVMALIALLVVLTLSLTARTGANGAFASEITNLFDFKLANSELVAQKSTISPGEEALFTVILRNDAVTSDSIDVTVQYPAELDFVGGSADGATHDAANRAISWENIAVGASSEARRTFKLRIAGTVNSSRQVQVFAAIAGNEERLVRATTVTLLPGNTPPPAQSDLSNSSKRADKAQLAPGEELRYIITLRNTGQADATIDVTDPVPTELSYVAGSADGGGSYTAGDRTVRWKDIAVAAGATVELSFKATASADITSQTRVVNTATIDTGAATLTRSTTVTVQPDSTPPPPARSDLSNSSKRADKAQLAPGEELRYIITLRNTGQAEATVDVTDAIPTELNYVAGSADGGGSYTAGDRTVRWKDIAVAAGATVELSFKATAPASIATSQSIVNTATIDTGVTTLNRSASVRLTPNPASPNLNASFKVASQIIARPGETVAYRIILYNNGTADAEVDVRDPLSTTVHYVAGSASNGGTYDPATTTLSWDNIVVGIGRQVILSYNVRMPDTVAGPGIIENTAEISVSGNTIRRSAMVLVLPDNRPREDDVVPPMVESVTIGNADVLTNRTTEIRVVATDNVAVEEVYLREWHLVTGRDLPRWEIVRSSGWIEYEEAIPWELGEGAGTHYVGAWARDAAGNISFFGPQAIDFASLSVPATAVSRANAVIYQVYYPAGVNVEMTVTPVSGDADLYVWYPGSMFLPNQASFAENSAVDRVSFTTPSAGLYLIAVVGYTSAVYDMTISNTGGPRIPVTTLTADPADPSLAAVPETTKTLPAMASLLGNLGIDPLGTITADPVPVDTQKIYLPLVIAP